MNGRLSYVLCALVFILSGCQSGTKSGSDAQGFVVQGTVDSSGNGASEANTSENSSSEIIPSATLSWTPPATREDGSELNDLAGYHIYYGSMPGIYTHVIDIKQPYESTYVVENLTEGTWFFAISAYDSSAVESELSGEVSKSITL